MDKMNFNITVKLSLMMLFQYMLFAVWWVPLAAYLTNMNLEGTQKALILSSMAIGCIVSPIIGMVADRHFPGQKVLAVLNLGTAVMLLLSGLTRNPNLLFLFLLTAMFLHMPTWGLTSSIAMTHSPSEQFPRIRLFGSIGWVASGIFSLITVNFLGLNFDGTNLPFFYGAGISVIAVMSNIVLPDTPPPAKGQKGSFIDVMGLRTIKLMKDKNFAVFIILSFLSMIPFSMYWSYCSEFLLDEGFKYISITMNWGQFAEMFLIAAVPFALRKIGLRWVMITGLIALVIRYLTFYFGVAYEITWFYFIGILVHGLIFGYFYLGGQIYIDKKAPPELKAQAQGFIFLVTFGLGLLTGNFVSRQVIDRFSETIHNVMSYDWNIIWGITTGASLVLLIAFMLFFRNEASMHSHKQQ